MSLNPEKMKQQIIKAIAVNPTDIEIKHIVKVEKDGYFEEEELNVILKVMIYNDKNSGVNIISDKMGTSYSSKNHSMIADYTANLEVNPKSAVEFQCKEGHMKIESIYPIIIKQIICGYQCDLERLN